MLSKFRREYKTLNTVRIHKDAILKNLRDYRKTVPGVSVCPVLKSNAYGHGLTEVAQILEPENCDFFIVDSLYEAYKLQSAKIKTPILILGYSDPNNLKGTFGPRKFPFHFTVSDFEGIDTYAHIGAEVHLEVDTGMNRMGFNMEDLEAALQKAKDANLNIVGLFTHLADADNPESDRYTQEQVSKFQRAISYVKKAGFNPKWIHAGNSHGAAQVQIPEVNMSRLGINLYKESLELETTVVALRRLKAGDKLGYNCTFQAPEDMQIAVLSAGYHEGIPRALSNKAPFLGRICMNHCFIEARDDMQIGSKFKLITRHGERSPEILAKKAGTIDYEILTNLNETIRRRIV